MNTKTYIVRTANCAVKFTSIDARFALTQALEFAKRFEFSNLAVNIEFNGSSENHIIRSIINYLRHLTARPDNWSDTKETLRKMGAKYLCSGMYSYVFQVGKFVVKIGDDNFDQITRPLLKKEAFKKYCPTVYWIHEQGFAMVCKFVELVKIQDGFGDFIYKVSSALFADGISTWDLHRENLMLCAKTKQPLVVDYGCLIPVK